MSVQIPKIPSSRDSLILIRINQPTRDHTKANTAQTTPIFLSTLPARAKLYKPESSVPSAQTFEVVMACIGVIPSNVKSGTVMRALPHPALPIMLQNKPIKKIKIYTSIRRRGMKKELLRCLMAISYVLFVQNKSSTTIIKSF